MRKFFVVLLFAVILLVSCSNEVSVSSENGLGYITFGETQSRAILASVDYESPYEKVWTITAVKTDNGETTGEGELTNVLLTDSIGPFSTGTWSFYLEGFEGETKVYEGSVDCTIQTGSNAIEVELESIGSEGSLSITGSNFSKPSGKTPTTVYLYLDNSSIESWSASELTFQDNLYSIPSYQRTAIPKGVHTISLKCLCVENSLVETPLFSVSIRVDANATTSLSFGKFQGRVGVEATINGVDALVE